MKIAILSRNSKLYSTQRLVEAARARGHRVRVLDPLRCYMRIDPKSLVIHYKGQPLPQFDAVIPRIGASVTFYGAAVVRQFDTWRARDPAACQKPGRFSPIFLSHVDDERPDQPRRRHRKHDYQTSAVRPR